MSLLQLLKTSQFGLLIWKIDGLGPNLKMGSSRWNLVIVSFLKETFHLVVFLLQGRYGRPTFMRGWRCIFGELHSIFCLLGTSLESFPLHLILVALFVMLRQSQPCIFLLIATLLELFGLVVVGTLELIVGLFNLRLIWLSYLLILLHLFSWIKSKEMNSYHLVLYF